MRGYFRHLDDPLPVNMSCGAYSYSAPAGAHADLEMKGSIADEKPRT